MTTCNPLLLENMRTQRDAIIEVAKKSRVDTGFGRLNRDGNLGEKTTVELWITARMTYVFCLATELGISGCRELAEHGISCLAKFQKDHEYGGFFAEIETQASPTGKGVPTATGSKKEAYAHAFVILASSAGVCADIAGSRDLLDYALQVTESIWWEPAYGRVQESFDRAFTTSEDYRGVNANMHTTECFLAAYDATGDRIWLDRAVGILEWVINQQARAHEWFIPEHFSAQWQELADYNKDQPAHPFRPWGYTIGHSFEWARLCLHARAALLELSQDPANWMLSGPKELISAAIKAGWDVDGAPGFVYTVGEDLQPVVHERMHWVPCEALGAACVMYKTLHTSATAEDAALKELLFANYHQWWEYCQKYFIAEDGLWWHELDKHNQPSFRTWPDKPDAYHVTQAMLLPELDVTPCFAKALANLDS